MQYDRYDHDASKTITSNLQDAVQELGEGDGKRTVALDMGQGVVMSGHWLEMDGGTVTVFSYEDGCVRTERGLVDMCRSVSVSDGARMPTRVPPSDMTDIAHAILVIETIERFGPAWTHEPLAGDGFPDRETLNDLDRDARNALIRPVVPTMLKWLKEDARAFLDGISMDEALRRLLAEHDPSDFVEGGQEEYDRYASHALKAVSPVRPRSTGLLATDDADQGTLGELPDDRRDVVQTEIFRIMLREAIRTAYRPYIHAFDYRSRLLSDLRVR